MILADHAVARRARADIEVAEVLLDPRSGHIGAGDAVRKAARAGRDARVRVLAVGVAAARVVRGGWAALPGSCAGRAAEPPRILRPRALQVALVAAAHRVQIVAHGRLAVHGAAVPWRALQDSLRARCAEIVRDARRRHLGLRLHTSSHKGTTSRESECTVQQRWVCRRCSHCQSVDIPAVLNLDQWALPESCTD